MNDNMTIEPGTPEHKAYLQAFPVHATGAIDAETLDKNSEKEEQAAKAAAREKRFKHEVELDYAASGRVNVV